LNQFTSETEAGAVKEATSLDEVLRSVWDKIHLATQLISQLRDEKRIHLARIGELEDKVNSLTAETLRKEQEVKQLRTEHRQLMNANGHQIFSEEEKEGLKNRIRDLLSKINSYL